MSEQLNLNKSIKTTARYFHSLAVIFLYRACQKYCFRFLMQKQMKRKEALTFKAVVCLLTNNWCHSVLNAMLNHLLQLRGDSWTAYVRKEKQICHLNTENSCPYGRRKSRFFFFFPDFSLTLLSKQAQKSHFHCSVQNKDLLLLCWTHAGWGWIISHAGGFVKL